jgi:hypothetical protein
MKVTVQISRSMNAFIGMNDAITAVVGDSVLPGACWRARLCNSHASYPSGLPQANELSVKLSREIRTHRQPAR